MSFIYKAMVKLETLAYVESNTQSISLRPIYLMQGEILWIEDFIKQIKAKP
ncbi:MAG: hypothetical protein RBS43_07220 [Candidatus Cloacimonas sp.]|nr:hypothetical protein [Candidatus Cloacimonas sp.]